MNDRPDAPAPGPSSQVKAFVVASFALGVVLLATVLLMFKRADGFGTTCYYVRLPHQCDNEIYYAGLVLGSACVGIALLTGMLARRR